MNRREKMEYYLPRVSAAAVLIVMFCGGLVQAVNKREARDCRDAAQMIESYEQCKILDECEITRIDISKRLSNERYLEKRCSEDE